MRPRTVCALTDEELVTLAPGPTPVVQPYLAGLEPAEREVARQVAARSLRVRGVIEPAPAPEADRFRISHDILGAVLTVRSTATAMVVLQRRLGAVDGDGARGAASGVRYLHLLGDLCVVEDVTEHGVHVLAICDAGLWRDAVRDFIDVPDDEVLEAAATGSARAVEVIPPEQLSARAGEAVMVADIAVARGPEVDPATWTAVRTRTCWVLARDGSGFQVTDRRTLLPEVEAWVSAQLGEAPGEEATMTG